MSATLTPQDFVEKWRDSQLKESAAYQEHFIDLCNMLGQGTPAELDKGGKVYTFQKSVVKSGTQVTRTENTLYGPDTTVTKGRKGFADVWYRSHFAWEYKGKHKDLVKAYEQLLQYREDLENPPLLVVCDFERYRIHTNYNNCVKKTYEFTHQEIVRPESLRILRCLWEHPEGLKPEKTVEAVTEEAAKEFAKLYDSLRRDKVERHAAAHFLMKLLFCLFAEDAGLLRNRIFEKVVKAGLEDGAALKGGTGGLK